MDLKTFQSIGKKKPLERFTHPLFETSRAWLMFRMQGDAKVKGIWIKQRGEDEPDIVIYYAHGKTLFHTRVAGVR